MFRQEEPEQGGPLSRREEARLIERAKRRDAVALRALIEAHQQRLFAFIWRVVRNRDDAEELCQEAFLRAFSALDTFDDKYRFSTWLFTIAYRLTLNSLRRKRPTTSDMDLTTLAGREVVEDQTARSEEVRELKAAVWSAVDQLSAPQRAAMLLYYKQEMSCQDIAEVLEIPVATVKSHLHRARARLKDLLEERIGDGSARARILQEWAG
jgi:RNA polymerase sigma-70 factor (ECF subfamily)